VVSLSQNFIQNGFFFRKYSFTSINHTIIHFKNNVITKRLKSYLYEKDNKYKVRVQICSQNIIIIFFFTLESLWTTFFKFGKILSHSPLWCWEWHKLEWEKTGLGPQRSKIWWALVGPACLQPELTKSDKKNII